MTNTSGAIATDGLRGDTAGIDCMIAIIKK